jgi:hypothetical protein
MVARVVKDQGKNRLILVKVDRLGEPWEKKAALPKQAIMWNWRLSGMLICTCGRAAEVSTRSQIGGPEGIGGPNQWFVCPGCLQEYEIGWKCGEKPGPTVQPKRKN